MREYKPAVFPWWSKAKAERLNSALLINQIYPLSGVEFGFRLFAARTTPVFRQIIKSNTVMFRRVINIAANRANIFANPEFDGYPTEVKLELGANIAEQDADEGDIDDVEFEEGIEDTYDWDEADPIEEHKAKKYYVDDVEVEVVDVNVQYLNENGKLIAENIKSFCKNFMLKRYPNEKNFVDAWQSASNKTKLLAGLSASGLFLDELRREYGREYDVYDILISEPTGTKLPLLLTL